jgi:hypothetical protein
MIRTFVYVAVLLSTLVSQAAVAMVDSARPTLSRRHRAAFLDNPMYQRLANDLDRQKSRYKQYTTVYLAIPKEFIFKEKALSEIKKYAQEHGVSLPFSVRNYISDAESYAGQPLRVEFNYVSLFDPNVVQPVIVPSNLFGSGRALTSHDFSVLSSYVPTDMLRKFAVFLKEYTDKIGYAPYFLIQLSIPNDRVDTYMQSQAVGGDYYALLSVQPDDALEHAGRFVVRLVKPGVSMLSNEDKNSLDQQFKEWIDRIGATVVSVAQEKKVADRPALLPRPRVPSPISSVVPPTINRDAKPVVKRSCKPVYSTPVVSSVPPRINRSSKPVGVPPINRASKPSVLRQGIRPPSLLPRPVAESAAYSDSAGLLGQIRAGVKLKSVPVGDINSRVDQTERDAFLQQIQGGMPLKRVQTRVGFSDGSTPLAILNRAVRAGDLGDAQKLDPGIQGAASIEWNNEDEIRPVSPARSDFATFLTVPTRETTRQQVIPLHANRMDPATEAALVAGLAHRRQILREEDDADDEDDWDDE